MSYCNCVEDDLFDYLIITIKIILCFAHSRKLLYVTLFVLLVLHHYTIDILATKVIEFLLLVEIMLKSDYAWGRWVEKISISIFLLGKI